MKFEPKKFFNREKTMPLILTGAIILVDQITKIFIEAKWPHPHYEVIADIFNNGFLQIVHRRNDAIAFSLGTGLPDFIKPVIFVAVPILVLGFLMWYYFKSDEFTNIQRWAAAGIIGGGIGNIIDRIFRSEGVVDFIDVRFFRFIFESGRWPTFNVADSSVVVCCILLFVTILASSKKEGKKSNE